MKSILSLLSVLLLISGVQSPAFSDPLAASGKKEVMRITLFRAIQRALEANRRLVAAGYSVQGEELNLESVRSEFDLFWYPSAETGIHRDGKQVDLGMTLRKKFTTGPTIEVSPTYGSTGGEYRGRLSVSLTVPLFQGRGREVTMSAVKSSEFQLAKAKNSYRQQQEQVILDTITTVYDIIGKRRQEKTYLESVKRLKREAQTARVKTGVGLAAPLDIYRAEIEVKEAEGRYILARSEAERARDRLKVLLALPLETRIRVSAPMVCEEIDLSPEEAVAVAMEHRRDLKQLERDLDELKRLAAVARHNLLPQADLAFRYDDMDLFDSRDHSDRNFWSIRLVSSTDLARKRQKSALASRLLDLKRKKLAAVEIRQKIREEIGNQFTIISQAKKRLEIRKKQIAQAEKKVKRAAIRFRHAMADNSELISSENELQRARIGLLKVETEYIVGTFRLRRKIGTLLEIVPTS